MNWLQPAAFIPCNRSILSTTVRASRTFIITSGILITHTKKKVLRTHMCLFEKNLINIDSRNDQMLGTTFADPEMLDCKLLFLWLLTPASSPLQFLVSTTA